MDSEFFAEQQRVRDQFTQVVGAMAGLARKALSPPAELELARAWFERADVVSKLLHSIPESKDGENKHVVALDWRMKKR